MTKIYTTTITQDVKYEGSKSRIIYTGLDCEVAHDIQFLLKEYVVSNSIIVGLEADQAFQGPMASYEKNYIFGPNVSNDVSYTIQVITTENSWATKVETMHIEFTGTQALEVMGKDPIEDVEFWNAINSVLTLEWKTETRQRDNNVGILHQLIKDVEALAKTISWDTSPDDTSLVHLQQAQRISKAVFDKYVTVVNETDPNQNAIVKLKWILSPDAPDHIKEKFHQLEDVVPGGTIKRLVTEVTIDDPE